MKCVVLVPGIMGSGLRNAAGRVWPPSVFEVALGYDRLDELLNPNLEVTGIIRKVGPVSVYSSLIDDITACGYRVNGPERLFIPFAYDWRQSNADTANRLADELDARFPNVDNLEITLLAHSMGGLVSRFLLESGDFDAKPWFSKITKLITLGTPHHGAPLALKRLSGNDGTLGLSGKKVKILGNDPRYPSLFQLVGYSGNGLAARRGARGEVPSSLDPFDPKIRTALGMNAQNVASAQQFWQTINGGRKPAHVSYFCIASSALKTDIRSELRDQTGNPLFIERKDGGDGTVPFSSAVLMGIPSGFSRKKHSIIFEDRDVRKKLFRILDAPASAVPQSAPTSVAFDTPATLGLSVGKDSYRTSEPIEIVVSYSTLMQNPKEFFRIIRFDPKTEEVDTNFVPPEVSSRFDGTDISTFSFTIANELTPGIYQVKPSREVDDPNETYFFVVNQDDDGQ